MKTIWKFEIPIARSPNVVMPSGAELLHVGLDPRGVPCIWAMVESNAPTAVRLFALCGTGHDCDGMSADAHAGSFVMGNLVFHLFHGGA